MTAVLASYRGYDTFGEAVVIFAAGLGVLLLLGLNGNAGRWTATPNGQRISAPSAPSAATPKLTSTSIRRSQSSAARKNPVREAEKIIPEKPKPTTASVKKSSVEAPAAPKRRGRPPGSKNKGSKNKAKPAAAKAATSSAKSAPKRRGRPPGSKNKISKKKPKKVASKATTKTGTNSSPKRGRGRPKGSKNKPKAGGTS